MQHRQSINLTPPQTAFLDAEARQLGITVAELIRRILDEYRLAANETVLSKITWFLEDQGLEILAKEVRDHINKSR